MLQYAPPLFASLLILAVDTFAIVAASDARLKALTVFFEALRFLAVASFQVLLLA